MKIFHRLLVSLLFMLAITSTSYAGSTDVFDQIIKKGEIRIGISVMAPWVMKDKKGNYVGFEIDVAKQLASDMGVKPVFKEYQWNDLIPALQKKEVDIIASGISITPKRFPGAGGIVRFREAGWRFRKGVLNRDRFGAGSDYSFRSGHQARSDSVRSIQSVQDISSNWRGGTFAGIK